MSSIPPNQHTFNWSEDDTPHYVTNQPLWLDGKREAQFLHYYDASYIKIHVFVPLRNGSTTSYIDYVDLSRISPRVISNGKGVM